MARKYQVIMRPIATVTGERGKWSFRAHGATHNKSEADEAIARLVPLGYQSRKIAI